MKRTLWDAAGDQLTVTGRPEAGRVEVYVVTGDDDKSAPVHLDSEMLSELISWLQEERSALAAVRVEA